MSAPITILITQDGKSIGAYRYDGTLMEQRHKLSFPEQLRFPMQLVTRYQIDGDDVDIQYLSNSDEETIIMMKAFPYHIDVFNDKYL